ncbi:hypothetical protein C8R45DRAFT_990411 [Mycena sanguinolenta]|nr:hypothetical protein C8R45DRAFT_990411 [Mycena sanguinolenta]
MNWFHIATTRNIRSLWLSFALLESLVNAISCPPFDTAGNALMPISAPAGTSTPTASISVSVSVLGCFYSSGDCLYLSNGRFDDADSTSTACPQLAILDSSQSAEPQSLSLSKSFSAAISSDSSKSENVSSKETRHRVQIAAIVATVVAVGCFSGLFVVVLWLRRRRRLTLARTLPAQFLEERDPTQRNLRSKEKSTNASDVSGSTSVPERTVVVEVHPQTPSEDGTPHEITQRMRRMEAQLDELLTREIHENSPPSYVG